MVLETRDQAELRAYLRRLREAGTDEALVRIDTLCARPADRSTYRLSRFVAGAARESDREPSGH
ncbi:hypothetical protein [Streptomyces xanthophaeus]|uniref:hypothetical protein n=1 Tax=Streptomyces xanthophaeus TaxID=67385 RepID=UPI0026483084|nr:hypothetical protein [Streptomyces xanthophaeus]